MNSVSCTEDSLSNSDTIESKQISIVQLKGTLSNSVNVNAFLVIEKFLYTSCSNAVAHIFADIPKFFKKYLKIFSMTSYSRLLKEEHALKKAIVAQILQLDDIAVFGGLPRDWILHAKASQEFYDYTTECTSEQKKKYYTDLQVHQTTALNRNTIPDDIDCICWDSSDDKLEEISQVLRQKLSLKVERFEVDMEYIPNVHGVPFTVNRIRAVHVIGGLTYTDCILCVQIDIVQMNQSDILPFLKQIPFTSDLAFISWFPTTLGRPIHFNPVSEMFHWWILLSSPEEYVSNNGQRITYIRSTSKACDASPKDLIKWYGKLLQRIVNKLKRGWIIPNCPFKLCGFRIDTVDKINKRSLHCRPYDKEIIVHKDGTSEPVWEFMNNLRDDLLVQGKFKSKGGQIYDIQPPTHSQDEHSMLKQCKGTSQMDAIDENEESAIDHESSQAITEEMDLFQSILIRMLVEKVKVDTVYSKDRYISQLRGMVIN